MCLASTSLGLGSPSDFGDNGFSEPSCRNWFIFHNLRRPLLKAELSSGCGGFQPEGHLSKWNPIS